MGNARSGPRRNVDLARLRDQHRVMARIRAFEETALAAAGAGLVTGAIHPCIGQEAVAVGICANLGRTDYLFATHRGHGHTLAKGADPAAMMCALFGREGGVCGGKGGSMSLTSLDRSCRTPFAANTTRQAVLKMAMSKFETPRSGLPV